MKLHYRWWIADNGVGIWADVRDLANTKSGSIVRYLPTRLQSGRWLPF